MSVPDGQGDPELVKAVESLSRAQKAASRGEYRETVGHCRDVMEAFGQAHGDDETGTVLAELVEGQRQMDKAHRQQLLRRALKVFTHPARHRGKAAMAIEYSGAEALTTLTIAAALVSSAPEPVVGSGANGAVAAARAVLPKS